jgi:hypothetical protein
MAGKYDGYSKIFGVLSIVLCLFMIGFILGPLAIYYGAKARGLDERKGSLGVVLGVVGLILWVILAVIVVYNFVINYTYT